MRMLIAFLVFATALSAQRGGGMGGGMRGGAIGGGMRGGGYRGGSPGHWSGGAGFIRGPGGGGYVRGPGGGGFVWGGGYNHGFGYRGGFYRYNSFYRPYYGTGFYYGAGYYPYVSAYTYPYWSYPSYYPYYSDYTYPAYPTMSAGPAVTVVSTGSSTPAPSIIVNNAPPRQQTRSEEEDSGVRQSPSGQSESSLQPEPQATRSQIYLIAARNGIVWAALAYWVDGPTLHFITVKGERKQLPLAQIDRELSEQFNRERNVPFRLP